MKQMIFTKYSGERKKIFQINTSILEDEKSRMVIKRAIYPQGIEHIKKIDEYYRNNSKILRQIDEKELILCPCSLVEDRFIVFDYLEGKTLESIMQENLEKNNLAEIKKNIEMLKKIIMNENKNLFCETSAFNEIFGYFELPENLVSAASSNVDLIAANIIINDKINIIDYEWTFNFPIPATFVLFRTLFHSVSFNKLQEKEQKSIYELCEISTKLISVFTQMEHNFQSFVSSDSDKLSTLIQKQEALVIPIDMDMKKNRVNTASISIGNQTESIAFFSKRYFYDVVKFEVDVPFVGENILIAPCNQKCILRINELFGYSNQTWKKINVIKTNAVITLGDDYYFYEVPCIAVHGNIEKLRMEVNVYNRNELNVQDIIKLTKENLEMKESRIIKLLKKMKLIRV